MRCPEFPAAWTLYERQFCGRSPCLTCPETGIGAASYVSNKLILTYSGSIIRWKTEQEQEPSVDEVRPKSAVVKTLVAQWPQLKAMDGLLVREWLHADGSCPRWLQLIPPPERRNDLIRLSHEGMTGGHMGQRWTMKQLRQRAHWPGWTDSVRQYLRRCSACARYIRGKPFRQGLLQDMSVVEPWERVGVDLTGPHPPSTKGFRYIVTIIDYFTGWAEAFPVRSQDANTVARVLVEQVFTRFGCPRQLLSDQGPCFEAALFQNICQLMNIEKIRTTAYKPSSNGRVERFHRTLNTMIAKLVSQSQRSWDLHLPYVMSAYRSTEHESTHYTPCRLFLGREVVLPVDLVLSDCRLEAGSPVSVDDFVADVESRTQRAFALVRETSQRLATTRAARYNLSVKPTKFTAGSWVWFHYPRRRPGTKEK